MGVVGWGGHDEKAEVQFSGGAAVIKACARNLNRCSMWQVFGSSLGRPTSRTTSILDPITLEKV